MRLAKRPQGDRSRLLSDMAPAKTSRTMVLVGRVAGDAVAVAQGHRRRGWTPGTGVDRKRLIESVARRLRRARRVVPQVARSRTCLGGGAREDRNERGQPVGRHRASGPTLSRRERRVYATTSVLACRWRRDRRELAYAVGCTPATPVAEGRCALCREVPRLRRLRVVSRRLP